MSSEFIDAANRSLRIELPKMHWEIGTPQEQILDFVQTMKRNMASIPDEGWPYKSKNAERDAYVDAYTTVENHIKRYMPLWEESK